MLLTDTQHSTLMFFAYLILKMRQGRPKSPLYEIYLSVAAPFNIGTSTKVLKLPSSFQHESVQVWIGGICRAAVLTVIQV